MPMGLWNRAGESGQLPSVPVKKEYSVDLGDERKKQLGSYNERSVIKSGSGVVTNSIGKALTTSKVRGFAEGRRH